MQMARSAQVIADYYGLPAGPGDRDRNPAGDLARNRAAVGRRRCDGRHDRPIARRRAARSAPRRANRPTVTTPAMRLMASSMSAGSPRRRSMDVQDHIAVVGDGRLRATRADRPASRAGAPRRSAPSGSPRRAKERRRASRPAWLSSMMQTNLPRGGGDDLLARERAPPPLISMPRAVASSAPSM